MRGAGRTTVSKPETGLARHQIWRGDADIETCSIVEPPKCWTHITLRPAVILTEQKSDGYVFQNEIDGRHLFVKESQFYVCWKQ